MQLTEDVQAGHRPPGLELAHESVLVSPPSRLRVYWWARRLVV